MSSANLTQLYAARPLLGSATAKDDLFYVSDESETVEENKDKGITRAELARALAESARAGASKYVIPFLPAITGLTGGGATKLDGLLDDLLVADVQIPCCFDLSPNDDDQRWKLRAKGGGEVADGSGLVAPVNPLFAAYIFIRIR